MDTMPEFGRRLSPELRDFLDHVVRSVPVDFGGGSGTGKALVLADLIIEYGITDTIEIGVYRGRSLLPVAALLNLLGAGTATGIDPWSADAALQSDAHAVGEEANEWVRRHPWDETHASVVAAIERLGLQANCRLVRMTSEEAAPLIGDGSVGLIHIDGNHDREAVQRDVDLYLPKLVPGGFLMLDDANWGSVRPVADALRDRLELVFQLFDGIALQEPNGNDLQVFRVPAA